MVVVVVVWIVGTAQTEGYDWENQFPYQTGGNGEVLMIHICAVRLHEGCRVSGVKWK